MPTLDTRPTDVRSLAAATPPSRERVVDLLRAASIAVVVLGHWLLAVVTVEGGDLVGVNLLTIAPWTQRLTWALQVMPLFFLVGGYANAASLAAVERRGGSTATWLRDRVRRLLYPTGVFAGVWVAVAATLRIVGVNDALVGQGARLVAVPLWFLAVYLLTVAAAPVAVRLHERHGLGIPVVLAAVVVAVDVARWGFAVPVVGWVNYLAVWLLPHQLGIAWGRGRLRPGRRLGWSLAGAGLLALWLLTTVGPYPVSLVGVDGAVRSNNSPPSSALVALTVLQTGVVLATRDRLASWLERPRVWAVVIAANGVAITTFLWHLTALVLVAVVLVPVGFPQPPAASLAWWLLRPVWVACLGAVLVLLVGVFRLVERPRPATGASTLARAATAAGAGGLAMALLATHGFATTDPWGVPWAALGALAIAWLATRPITTRSCLSSTAPAHGRTRPSLRGTP